MKDRASPCRPRPARAVRRSRPRVSRVRFEIALEHRAASARRIARLAALRVAQSGRDHMRVTDQRLVGVLEQRDVGDAERADRFSVIAVREAHELAFCALRRDCAK